MGRGLDDFLELRDEAYDWVRLRWANLRLGVVEKLSVGMGKAFGWVIFILLVLSAITFLMIALALWLGELLGHTSYGFLIAGGALLLCAVIGLLVGGRLVTNSMVRYFVDMFFTENDNDYDPGV